MRTASSAFLAPEVLGSSVRFSGVHTALYRYIQPVIAGILAITRGQAHFDAANITASVFIFAGVILVVVGYKYYVRHGLPKLRSDGRLEH